MLNINDIAPPSGESFKFENIGDTIKGVLTYVPDAPTERINKFNGRSEQVVKLIIDTGDGDPRAIYPVQGSTMARAIGDAVRAAGATSLETGGTLAVRFSETKDTGKPQPLKMYAAKYEPPKPAANIDLF
jgi:hypothetical protein